MTNENKMLVEFEKAYNKYEDSFHYPTSWSGFEAVITALKQCGALRVKE